MGHGRAVAPVREIAVDDAGTRQVGVKQPMRRALGLVPMHIPEVSETDNRTTPIVPHDVDGHDGVVIALHRFLPLIRVLGHHEFSRPHTRAAIYPTEGGAVSV